MTKIFAVAILAVPASLIALACTTAAAQDKMCAYRGRRPRCPAHGDHVIRSMTTGAAHELDGAVGFIF
jgi:hypothetical protein